MKALILVDFEREWVDKNSEYYVGDISAVLQKTNQLLDFCRKKKYKIIFTQHVEKGSADAFKENSAGVGIIPALHKKDTDVLITKHKISPFYQTLLEKELKSITEMVVAGILTNLCVRSVVQDAYDRDFRITVIKDCCVAMDKHTQDFTFKDLKATREEITFMNASEFIAR